MRLFRSEEEIPDDGGATLPVDQLADLAGRWYGDRLDPDWRPRTPDESQAVLASVGLTGEFWRLT
jgi:hypothetical protein